MGEILQVRLVVPGNHDARDARPLGAEDLFLEPADRQDPPGNGDLTRHGDVVADGPPRQRRDHGRGHRDSGRGPVLGDGARGNVDVDVAVEVLLLDAEPCGVGTRVGPGGARGLFHDVAELAGQDQLSLASHERRLDEHDVSAGRGVVHAGRDPDLVFAGHLLGMDPRTAEKPAHVGL